MRRFLISIGLVACELCGERHRHGVFTGRR